MHFYYLKELTGVKVFDQHKSKAAGSGDVEMNHSRILIDLN